MREEISTDCATSVWKQTSGLTGRKEANIAKKMEN